MTISEARRQELSDILHPVAPPRELDNVYTDDQRERLLNLVRQHAPWRTILAQEFPSFEELIATMSGSAPEGTDFASFITPTFRGYIANYSATLYLEIHDCFYNERFLDLAKSYWNAKYAKPQMMLFIITAPRSNFAPGHLDTPRLRGL